MYRVSSDLAPCVTHPDLPQFHNQVRECRGLFRDLGREARRLDVRLSFHPSQFVVINTPDPVLLARSTADLAAHAEMLDHGTRPGSVMVIHGGGTYGDMEGGIARWIPAWKGLPPNVQRRLVLENDDLRYSAASALRIQQENGVRLIFDVQHFHCLNPEAVELEPTVECSLSTWPAGVRPRIHFSSPRTEMREVKRRNRKTGRKETVLRPPVWAGHADYNHPFESIAFLRRMRNSEFDVMLEAKAKDLARIRLRNDLVRYGPDVALRFGLAAVAPEPESFEISAGALEESMP